MIKFAAFFLFLTIVYCANVKRQIEQDDQNAYYDSDEDNSEEIRERQMERTREIDSMNQGISPSYEEYLQWYRNPYYIEGDNEQQRYEWAVKRELMKRRNDQEYERLYELGRRAQPYRTSYDSQVIYPWGGYFYV